jgi:hypothetical protein
VFGGIPCLVGLCVAFARRFEEVTQDVDERRVAVAGINDRVLAEQDVDERLGLAVRELEGRRDRIEDGTVLVALIGGKMPWV